MIRIGTGRVGSENRQAWDVGGRQSVFGLGNCATHDTRPTGNGVDMSSRMVVLLYVLLWLVALMAVARTGLSV